MRARVEVDGRQQGDHRQREAVGLREGDGPEGLLGHEDGGLPLARVRGRGRVGVGVRVRVRGWVRVQARARARATVRARARVRFRLVRFRVAKIYP